ncbi:hypothetical protein J2S46_004032 [Kitasatospora herbaricolor]|nr:hypothetical protein [Kitasatospora herbaricolor]
MSSFCGTRPSSALPDHDCGVGRRCHQFRCESWGSSAVPQPATASSTLLIEPSPHRRSRTLVGGLLEQGHSMSRVRVRVRVRAVRGHALLSATVLHRRDDFGPWRLFPFVGTPGPASPSRAAPLGRPSTGTAPAPRGRERGKDSLPHNLLRLGQSGGHFHRGHGRLQDSWAGCSGVWRAVVAGVLQGGGGVDGPLPHGCRLVAPALRIRAASRVVQPGSDCAREGPPDVGTSSSGLLPVCGCESAEVGGQPTEVSRSAGLDGGQSASGA